jgi:hypothetical protein
VVVVRRRLTLAIVLALTLGSSTGRPESESEYRLKAAFLYNFARFVEWPAGALDASPTFRICIVGEDPFGGDLPVVVQGKRLQDRPIEIFRTDGAELAGCHMVFIGSGETGHAARLLTGVVGRGVLTVGETQEFIRAGGMIGMRLEEDRVRFDVNVDAAQRAGLRMSSQLLKLATRVIQ